jgi:hypothetical protein
MKKLILLFTCLSFIHNSSYSCQCPPPGKLSDKRINEINNSDFIIIGSVFSISNNYKDLNIEVIEVFKGNFVIGRKLTIINNIWCEPVVEETGKWLIYGNFTSAGLIINECGLSRSIEKPFKNSYFRHYHLPPPPPFPYDKAEYNTSK